MNEGIKITRVLLTVLNILSHSGQPAAARQLVSYCSFSLSLLLFLLSYAIALLFYLFHMLRVLRPPSLDVILSVYILHMLSVEAAPSQLPCVSGWLRSCSPFLFYVLVNFHLAECRPNHVYKMAAFPQEKGMPEHPIPFLAPGHHLLNTRCRWP